METRAHYIAIGAFVLAVLTLAFVAALWLGRVELAQGAGRRYDINFKGAVTGLSEGSAVLYNGVHVGRVSAIRLNPGNVEEVRVTVEIDKDAVIKTDAEAVLVANLLSGQSIIQIRGGTQGAPVLEAKPGQQHPVIASKPSPFERVYARTPALLNRLTDVADKLDAVLDRKNRKALADSLQNVRAMSAILARRAKQLDGLISGATGAVGSLHTLLNHADKGLSGPHGLTMGATKTLGDIDRLARNLDQTNRQIQGVIRENRGGLQHFSQHTLAQLGDLLEQTQRFVAGLSRLTGDIKRDPRRFLFGTKSGGYHP